MTTAQAPLPGPDKGGQWVRMGDVEYKVAPLNFKGLRELGAQLAMLKDVAPGTMPNAEQVTALCAIAHAALKRNYPEMTVDEVEDRLDFGNFGPVLSAVIGVSGLKKEGEPGEPTTTLG
jgi:hypothetical protein